MNTRKDSSLKAYTSAEELKKFLDPSLTGESVEPPKFDIPEVGARTTNTGHAPKDYKGTDITGLPILEPGDNIGYGPFVSPPTTSQ